MTEKQVIREGKTLILGWDHHKRMSEKGPEPGP